jgi:hypothetical protein
MEMMKITRTINGRTEVGLAYWSDRTIPGKWVYPSIYQPVMTTEETEKIACRIFNEGF